MKKTLATVAVLACAGAAQATIISADAATEWGASDTGVVYTFAFTLDEVTSVNGFTAELAHSYGSDLQIYLAAPDGQFYDILFQSGFRSSNLGMGDNTTFGLADTAEYSFGPAGDDFVATAAGLGNAEYVPAGNYAFVQVDIAAFPVAAGEWTLVVADAFGGDPGAIGNWSLDITEVPTPGAAGLLGLAGIAAVRRRR